MTYTVKQAAKMLNKSEQTVRKMARSGKLKATKIHGGWWIEIKNEPSTELKCYQVVDGRIRERSVFE